MMYGWYMDRYYEVQRSCISAESVTWLCLMPLSDWVCPAPRGIADVPPGPSFESQLCPGFVSHYRTKLDTKSLFFFNSMGGKWNNSAFPIAPLFHGADVRSPSQNAEACSPAAEGLQSAFSWDTNSNQLPRKSSAASTPKQCHADAPTEKFLLHVFTDGLALSLVSTGEGGDCQAYFSDCSLSYLAEGMRDKYEEY